MVFNKKTFSQVLSQYPKQKIINNRLISAAVLIPLFNLDGKYNLLFTKRTNLVETHKGEISFPGGVFDKNDSSLLDTALRETEEEVGINSNDVEILGELDDIETNTNFNISPFVGVIPYPYEFRINGIEIEKLLNIPLDYLINGNNSWEELWNHKGKNYLMYFYRYEDNLIWGATAKIIKQFLTLIEKA